jgi:hypothetical protein
MSPRMRISVAVQRPASRRKISSSGSGIFRRAQFDGSFTSDRGLAGPVERGVEVGASMIQNPPICSLVSA